MSRSYYRGISDPLSILRKYIDIDSLQLTPDKALMLAKLLIVLENLGVEINDEIIEKILYATSITRKGKTPEKIKETIIQYQSTMNILRRLTGRRKTTISNIINRHITSNDILDYIWLRSKGYLVRSRDRRLLIDRKIYSIELDKQCSREITYNELVKYLKEIPSSLWRKVIDRRLLLKLRDSEIVGLANKFYGYDKRIDNELLYELSRRLKERDKHNIEISDLTSNEKLISELVRKTGYLGPLTLPYIKQGEATGEDINKIVNDLYELSLQERWKLLSDKNIPRELIEKIAEMMDPLSIAVLNEKKFSSHLKNLILLGKAVNSYVSYYLTGDIAYLDYMYYFLDKIDPEMLDYKFKPVYESLLRNDVRGLTYSLGKINPSEFVELISLRIWDIYTTSGSISQDVLYRALRLGYMLLKYIVKTRGEVTDKYIVSSKGKIDVRRSIYNVVRSNYYFTYICKKKLRRIIVVLDTSGSMIKYSLSAVLSLAKLIMLTKVVLLFSDKVSIVKIHRNNQRDLIMKFLEGIYVNGFKGYTNLSLALRKVYEYVKPRDKVVIISDLKQTVGDEDPLRPLLRLISRNINIVFLVPPSYDRVVADKFRELGVHIYPVKQIDKVIRRILLS